MGDGWHSDEEGMSELKQCTATRVPVFEATDYHVRVEHSTIGKFSGINLVYTLNSYYRLLVLEYDTSAIVYHNKPTPET